ncbi:Triacylglycerol esterase/lipase EstA, alpha/beta hydrolase fold [Streptoalloteichus hindustanus]|uniref:Triacylglycerol esterase/lipase EstA, alpha/beta hydrolase fold n=1 Tax=Streptoalloteichus hindustanus TaxID=2017 RepID=A0A1M5KGM2_STRHI|nr:Triacylglycerol esterase/lipase EstA, alpha/beta hydrolase fold [Streptoalloteichus hindustanus]
MRTTGESALADHATRGSRLLTYLVDAATRHAGDAARTLTRPSTLRGLTVEAAWLAARALLYPWGAREAALEPGEHLRHYRTDDLPPWRRGQFVTALAAGAEPARPVVLVHGIVDNRSAFTVLAPALRRRGFAVVHAVNYGVLTAVNGDVRQAARALGEQVDQVRLATGSDRVDVVGHSLGGLIARYYVQRLDGDRHVDTLVTLGAPHAGTLTAHLLPTRLARQLRPGSPLLAELAEPAPGCRTRFVAVWSDLDQVVLPRESARLTHPDLTVEVHRVCDVGHLSLPMAARAVAVVVTALTRSAESPRDGQPAGTCMDL